MYNDNRIKVWVVDDHKMFADAISKLFEVTSDIAATNILYNAKDVLLQLKKANLPDVFLIDVEMPAMDGCELTKQIKNKFPQSKVISISMHSQESYVELMIKCGVSGFLLKNEKPEALFDAIRKVHSGGNAFSNDTSVNFLLSKYHNNEKISDQIELTNTELKIIRLIKQELSNKQIADKLSYSVSSVENHKRQLMKKLGVKTTLGILKYSFENNIK